ncbi:hypothetical protein J2129_001341 [Methanofollis sp. W23]|uniref:hypothetical protein n=1 Tax=Methanofollis sp. W23 TaxID=2817849 RepID=UPI001AEB944F|nr:hypothetical protein [Methanofollis sp. W23]MBP2145887.1 hypothetical protein [Methanofollis sp. W23]
MKQHLNSLPLTLSLLGIACVLHFIGSEYYFFGAAPTGFSIGTLGLIIAMMGVLLSGYLALKEE